MRWRATGLNGDRRRYCLSSPTAACFADRALYARHGSDPSSNANTGIQAYTATPVREESCQETRLNRSAFIGSRGWGNRVAQPCRRLWIGERLQENGIDAQVVMRWIQLNRGFGLLLRIGIVKVVEIDVRHPHDLPVLLYLRQLLGEARQRRVAHHQHSRAARSQAR